MAIESDVAAHLHPDIVIDPSIGAPVGCVRPGVVRDGRRGEAQGPPQLGNNVAGNGRHMGGMLRSTQDWSARRV